MQAVRGKWSELSWGRMKLCAQFDMELGQYVVKRGIYVNIPGFWADRVSNAFPDNFQFVGSQRLSRAARQWRWKAVWGLSKVSP